MLAGKGDSLIWRSTNARPALVLNERTNLGDQLHRSGSYEESGMTQSQREPQL